MTARFDPTVFRAINPNDISIYLNSLPQDRSKPEKADLDALINDIFALSEVHSIYVAIWAVDAGDPLPADTVVELLRRCQDRGGQHTLARVLSDAKDLSQHHIDQVEAIHAASPYFILEDGLAELKEAWRKRFRNQSGP